MKHRTWLVPILVLAIPVGYVAVRVITSPGIVDTKMDKARYEVTMLSDVLEEYRKEHGRYPTTEEGLLDLVRVGLIRKVPNDPWQHPYEYRFPGSRNIGGFDLWTYGADGKRGGDDVDEDIGNWDDDA